MHRVSWPKLAVLVVGAMFALRLALALRPGIWADEIFSLAMATGHSLEHPAREADPRMGDFVEPRAAEPPAALRRYLQHETPPVGLDRVVRAVLLSDTSPPAYYLILNGWTRAFGTGDAALKLLSVAWASLTLPFIWLLGRDLRGRRMAWSAAMLFALSPVSLFYSLEGRMYSQVWFVAAALGWLTLRLERRGARPGGLLLWAVVAGFGLLTHYFFLFVVLAFGAWLFLRPRSLPRASVAALAALTALLVTPWYLEVPASLSRWRVSGDWLAAPLRWPEVATRPFELAWSLLAGGSHWGGSPLVDGALAAAYLGLGLWILLRGRLRRMFARPYLLLWAWVAATVLGVLAFDLLRDTSASRMPRYVLAGFPAAMLLAALAMRQLRPAANAAFLGLVALAWTAGAWPIVFQRARPQAAYPTLIARLESWARPSDLILVHSIPSGVLGMARYLHRDLPLASWIAPLGVRQVPDDLERLLAGRRRVALVQIHSLARPSPAEPWLREHARLVRREAYIGPLDSLTTDLEALPADHATALREHRLIEIFYFEPREAEGFVPGAGPARSRRR
ncbi:MAG: glycosyltransferase family 39 protein [Gemmatimonadales bacterium]|nr:glycosyltransferase family 39 protein [Gemmatimonadales bacterium]